MSFISFLKKAGQILANVAAIEAGVEPIFKAGLPAAAGSVLDKMDLIFKSIVATEGQFAAAYPGQQTGAQKLAAAATLVGPVLATVDTIRGKQIANEADYNAGIQTLINGAVLILNALKGGDVKDAGAVLTAPAEAIATK